MKLLSKVRTFFTEIKSLGSLIFNYNYFLIALYPFMKFIKKFSKKKTSSKIFFLVNDNNMRELYIAQLFLKNFKVELIYKKKPSYLNALNKNKINYKIYSNFYEFYFFFLINKSIKVLFCANTLSLLPYTLINRNIICNVYDSVAGQGHGYIAEFFEKINVYFIKYIIERDPRLHSNYKKIYKKLKIKNVFIQDSVKNLNFNFKKKEKEIHAVSLGWIDDKICNLDKTFENLCKAGIYVHVFHNDKNIQFKYPYLKKIKDKYSKYMIFEKPINGEELIEKISSFHLGISPHQEYYKYDNLNYLEKYYSLCPSTRISDYLSANFIHLVSKKYKFNVHVIKRYGGKIIYFEDIDINKIDFVKTINKINFQKNNTKYLYNKNYFNDNLKSEKLLNFIKKNFNY